MAVLHLTTGDFDSTIAQGTTLVDFWAGWCQPCAMLAPTIDALAEKYAGKVKVAKVDVDTQTELARRYGVMSIPTLILFRDGQQVEKVIGVHSQMDLEAMLTK